MTFNNCRNASKAVTDTRTNNGVWWAEKRLWYWGWWCRKKQASKHEIFSSKRSWVCFGLEGLYGKADTSLNPLFYLSTCQKKLLSTGKAKIEERSLDSICSIYRIHPNPTLILCNPLRSTIFPAGKIHLSRFPKISSTCRFYYHTAAAVLHSSP